MGWKQAFLRHLDLVMPLPSLGIVRLTDLATLLPSLGIAGPIVIKKSLNSPNRMDSL